MKTLPNTVFVVDDDSAIRGSLKLLLKSVGLNVNTFESAQAFLDAYSDDLSGCLLLDVRMPGISGSALQEQLNLRGSLLPVIFITGHGDVSMAVEAMQHGAFDFVQKPFHDQDLLERVHRALERNERTRSQLSAQNSIRQRFESLTPREREVLEQVTRGSSNKLMAYELSISQRTIEIHRARIMEKMQAESLAHLVRMTAELDRTTHAAPEAAA
jgi:two-component system, LuxR family, response regulator FixJ